PPALTPPRRTVPPARPRASGSAAAPTCPTPAVTVSATRHRPATAAHPARCVWPPRSVSGNGLAPHGYGCLLRDSCRCGHVAPHYAAGPANSSSKNDAGSATLRGGFEAAATLVLPRTTPDSPPATWRTARRTGSTTCVASSPHRASQPCRQAPPEHAVAARQSPTSAATCRLPARSARRKPARTSVGKPDGTALPRTGERVPPATVGQP